MRLHFTTSHANRVAKGLRKALISQNVDIPLRRLQEAAARMFGFDGCHQMALSGRGMPAPTPDEESSPGEVASRHSQYMRTLEALGVSRAVAEAVLARVRPSGASLHPRRGARIDELLPLTGEDGFLCPPFEEPDLRLDDSAVLMNMGAMLRWYGTPRTVGGLVVTDRAASLMKAGGVTECFARATVVEGEFDMGSWRAFRADPFLTSALQGMAYQHGAPYPPEGRMRLVIVREWRRSLTLSERGEGIKALHTILHYLPDYDGPTQLCIDPVPGQYGVSPAIRVRVGRDYVAARQAILDYLARSWDEVSYAPLASLRPYAACAPAPIGTLPETHPDEPSDIDEGEWPKGYVSGGLLIGGTIDPAPGFWDRMPSELVSIEATLGIYVRAPAGDYVSEAMLTFANGTKILLDGGTGWEFLPELTGPGGITVEVENPYTERMSSVRLKRVLSDNLNLLMRTVSPGDVPPVASVLVTRQGVESRPKGEVWVAPWILSGLEEACRDTAVVDAAAAQLAVHAMDHGMLVVPSHSRRLGRRKPRKSTGLTMGEVFPHDVPGRSTKASYGRELRDAFHAWFVSRFEAVAGDAGMFEDLIQAPGLLRLYRRVLTGLLGRYAGMTVAALAGRPS